MSGLHGSAHACSEWTGLEGGSADPVACGLLWYTHVGKTGGDSVKTHLKARAKEQHWKFFDLYMPTRPIELHLPHRWESTKVYADLLHELNSTHPRAVVHQHSGFSGVGEYMLDRVFRPLACRFQHQTGNGCRVVLTTTLREPTARVLSHAAWADPKGLERLKEGYFVTFARNLSNFQTKYQLFGSDWRMREMKGGNVTFDSMLLEPALACLKMFDLVGRTEELDAFLHAIDAVMGWPRTNGTTSHKHTGSNVSLVQRPTHDVWEAARQYNTVDTKLYASFCRRGSSSSGRPSRLVQPLCGNAAPYRFPHYWTADLHRWSCAEGRRDCAWSLVRDGACRNGNMDASPYRETGLVCEDFRGHHSPSSALQPYRRKGSPRETLVLNPNAFLINASTTRSITTSDLGVWGSSASPSVDLLGDAPRRGVAY